MVPRSGKCNLVFNMGITPTSGHILDHANPLGPARCHVVRAVPRNMAGTAQRPDAGEVVGIRVGPQRRLMVRLEAASIAAIRAAPAVAVEGLAAHTRPSLLVKVSMIVAHPIGA